MDTLESTLYLKNCLTAFQLADYITNDAKVDMFVEYARLVNKEKDEEIKRLKVIIYEIEKPNISPDIDPLEYEN